MSSQAKVIGVLKLTDGNVEKDVEVLGITPRTLSPSLDIRWSLAGVYVLRLHTMILLAIPRDRVRGRDPTPWSCTNPRHAWSLWWNASLLSRKEKRRRCPPEFHPKPDGVCPSKVSGPCRYLFAGRGCVDCGGARPRGEIAQ